MTEEACIDFCDDDGFAYAGVEYSQECFCANVIGVTGSLADDGDCYMACTGSSDQLCGGPNRLNVFHNDDDATSSDPPATNPGVLGWDLLGCYTDSAAARTLTANYVGVQGGTANMSVLNCVTACSGAGFSLAGVEYSAECYCGNEISNDGALAPEGLDGCDMLCNGNTSEFCGGASRLDVYGLGQAATITATLTSSTATTSSGATATSSVATISPTSLSLAGNWTYRGCYVDNTYGRILTQQPDNANLTIETCVETCVGLDNTIAGLEYSTQCFCGNAIINGGDLADDDSECDMTCGGNSSEICGGPNRMSIYAVGNLTSYDPPTVKNTSLPGDWQYQGCLQDSTTRVFPYQTDMTNNATIEACLNLCHEYEYGAAALEFGYQCFCGDDTDRINANATYLATTACNYACSGDPTALCGGADSMNYYSWPDLNFWGQGTGNSAGAYEFLIGGPVIPLITSANRNGKVTFVEKHGTGPPNSTGAFELDLSAIETWDLAWREMQGLVTDVFCSAGLTLPDAAGRVINIGGWSADSLYGVRFYTPDGSPGVPGQNGWEENVKEVALQTGRWYPSAMMMVNGSILVVGGENGSNGPPVPNLEILPQPAGGTLIYCDWLDRTDPYNLYPFLAILPSGGILVTYYNEARILDETTLETVRTLPNIPGAVNNFLGGRTYPLEGSSMLFPQSAPWTDPLTVLICGGSTPYAAVAIDNCVTIQPEVENANWTIERMPSKRVIPTMVALPDGTFLIMNGAMQGVAGFGLANDPNLDAVLYDPTQPLHKRMTRLANTTVARLYHNEALLLQDGRVLVSGSDPENTDNKYPQEYRVEVFIPPYLMGLDEPLSINVSQQVFYQDGDGSSSSSSSSTCGGRPVFNLAANNSDWSFGGEYSFTLLCGSAAKVSLMGSVSSTHGNSMGARTLFPTFSCTGTSCTVTAPPNGHVTGGPGWFMMFVIGDNGVPSIAEW
ncbi:hypothetical protein DV735_g193, partial [Chaetothyriales sp. CBS 134920]